MNYTTKLLAAALALASFPALAQTAETTEAPAYVAPTGDAAAGEALFNQCQSCHVVRDEAGQVLAGRNSRTGPNLHGVVGRIAGTYPEFRYGDGIVAAGEMGLIWDEDHFVAYVQDPTAFLREYTGNNRARGNMSFRLRNEQNARDLYAFLATFSPVPSE